VATDAPSTAWPAVVDVVTISRVAPGAVETGEGRSVAPVADRQLAARLMAGDAEALAEVYREYANLVFGVCRRVLNDVMLAEDVTQEVFVYLWQSPERFDASRGSLRAWLGLLAHHRSVDRVRAEGRRTRREQQQEPASTVASEVDDHLAAAWLSDQVRVALDQLPAEQREAVVLAYYGGRTYRQVAVDQAIPEGTAKSRLRLALAKLELLLRPPDTDQDDPAWT
jgi:RNA polymerase sigma factor (sigma-70 family)